jgi:hypothetical protein
LRAEQLDQFARLYLAAVPARFRIGKVVILKHCAAFAVSETRLSASWLSNLDWGDADYREKGLTVVRFELRLRDGKLSERWEPLVAISLHGLGRRFERAPASDSAAILADLALLLGADASAGQITTPHGTWLGDRIDCRISAGDPGVTRRGSCVSVRTFVT